MDRTTGAAPGARANAQRAAVLLAPPPGEGLAWGTPTPCGRSEGVLSSPPPNHLLVYLIHIFLLLLLKTKGVQSLK